jgi:coenzyme PQQ precursor peptide PqqA
MLKFNVRRNTMWTTPAATEMRFGFEVTMYVMQQVILYY